MNAPVVSLRHRMLSRGLGSSRLLGRRFMPTASLLVTAGLAVIASGLLAPRDAPAQAAAPAAGAFTIADGALSLEAPQAWKRVPPKSQIVETEFSIPTDAKGADGMALPAGRMTVMGAGGTVEANIDRWYGQFTQPDGKPTREKATTKKIDVAGCKVTLVDIPGTYKDSPGGPFAGGQAVDRPDYRMLAAIVESKGGNYFLKFYGPAATVAAHADGFLKMVEGMVAKGN